MTDAKLYCTILLRYEKKRRTGWQRKQSDPASLVLGLTVGAEPLQLLIGEVVNRTSRQLLAIEELDQQVLRTMNWQQLGVCL